MRNRELTLLRAKNGPVDFTKGGGATRPTRGSARACANERREAARKFENRRRAAVKFLKTETEVLNDRFAIGKYRFVR